MAIDVQDKIGSKTDRRWMALREACRVLEVNRNTLRLWSDSGYLRSFRTPGGHRRFYAEDVLALLEANAPAYGHRLTFQWDGALLKRIRRRLNSSGTGSAHWHEAIDPHARTRMRLFGRRLLEITSQYLSQKWRRGELLQEARQIGEEYGWEMAQRHLPLKDGLEAFLFFRNSLLESLSGLGNTSGENGATLWQAVNSVTDQVLLGMTTAFEQEQSVITT